MEKSIIVLKKGVPITINPDGDFYNSVGGDKAAGKTTVSLEYLDTYLRVCFEGNEDINLNTNRFTNCNDPLYQQEVFECFIAPGEEAPIDYIEVEINPNNALFVSKIHNPNRMGTENTGTPIDCDESKIVHSIVKDESNEKWKAELKLPFSLIHNPKAERSIYRANFFRIRSIIGQTDNTWRANPDNSEYSCWQSTMAEGRPNFHRTDFMGSIILQE